MAFEVDEEIGLGSFLMPMCYRYTTTTEVVGWSRTTTIGSFSLEGTCYHSL